MDYAQKQEIKEAVLDFLIKGGTLAAFIVAPGLAKAFGKPLQKYLRSDEGKRDYRALMQYMKRRQLIEISETKDGFEVAITEKGKKRLRSVTLENLRITPQKQWDGKWRMIIFDIPEAKKNTRNLLSFKLKRMGFYQLQKSVWITPFPCREEFEVLKVVYGISPHVSYIEISDIDQHNRLVKHFQRFFIN